jgi:uncharacterized protein (TIGR02588 family)
MTRKKKSSTAANAPRTRAEWVSLIISVLLLAAVVTAVVTLWVKSSDKPARFRVERGAIRNEGAHYYLPVTVINEGDSTGAQVMVEGKLMGAEREETASTTFDFIPARSSAEGILIFASEPTSADVRVVSYQNP